MTMRWLHFIAVDEIMEPRTGLFVARSKQLLVLSFVVAITGRKKRLFYADYNNRVVESRPRWWSRLEFVWASHWRYSGFRWRRGVSPAACDYSPGRSVMLHREVARP